VDAIEKFVKSTSTSTTSWGYNANQVVCRDVSVSNQSGRFTFMVCMLFAYGVSLLSCGTNHEQYLRFLLPGVEAVAAGSFMTRTASSLSVTFLDWVVQFSHNLLLTRGISIRSYPTQVRVTSSRAAVFHAPIARFV
jgi:hypothetical protein